MAAAVGAIGGFLTQYGGYIALASSAVSAYSSVEQGKAAKAGYAAQARTAEDEARQARLASSQVSALRLRELGANLAAIEAARAGKNLTGDSPTQAALIKSFTKESLDARDNEVGALALRGISAQNAAAAAGLQGKFAERAGYLGAIGDTADVAMRFGGLMSQPRKKMPNSRETQYAVRRRGPPG